MNTIPALLLTEVAWSIGINVVSVPRGSTPTPIFRASEETHKVQKSIGACMVIVDDEIIITNNNIVHYFSLCEDHILVKKTDLDLASFTSFHFALYDPEVRDKLMALLNEVYT